MDVFRLRKDGTQNGSSPDFYPGEGLESVCRGERHARNAQRSAELPRDEVLVIRGDIQPKLRLLAVAEEQGIPRVAKASYTFC